MVVNSSMDPQNIIPYDHMMVYLTLVLPLSRLISATAASVLSEFRQRMTVSAPNDASLIAVCLPICNSNHFLYDLTIVIKTIIIPGMNTQNGPT